MKIHISLSFLFFISKYRNLFNVSFTLILLFVLNICKTHKAYSNVHIQTQLFSDYLFIFFFWFLREIET